MGCSVIAEKLEAARKLGRAIAADAGPHVDSVYIAGSLTAGLGNPTSDADLFVLLAPGAPVGDDVTQYGVDGHRVDVERYALEDVEALVADIAGFDLERDKLTALHKLPDQIDFVFRMHSSETVVGSAALSRLQEQIEKAMPSIRRTAINHTAVAINAYLEDFLGAAADGDLDTASIAGQGLVAHAGKALTAASGDLYFSSKWVYKQLTRTPVGGFPMDAFARFQRGTWTEDGTAGAEDLVFFAQTCIAAGQLMAEADAPLAHWPSWTTGDAADGLWRHPAFNVLQTGDGVLLHWELHRQLQLKQPVAFVWALCDGRSPEEIAANVEALADSVPALRTLTRERVAGILAALRGKGLVAAERYSVLGTI